MSTYLNDHLEKYRRNVLKLTRIVVFLSIVCFILFILLSKNLMEIPVVWVVQLAIGGSYLMVAWWQREKNLKFGTAWATGAVTLLFSLALYNFGPVMNFGVSFFILWSVFFYNRLVLPVALVSIFLVSLAMAESFGLTPGWSMTDVTIAAWFRMISIVVFISGLAGYLLQQLLFGLTESLIQESESRRRELEGQREKEINDRALSQTYRMESLGRLASGVAHDFNNILTVLMSCIEVLRSVQDPRTRDGVLTDMESAVNSANATSRQLLSLSSQGTSPGQPADPLSSLRSLVSNLKRLLPENISIEEFVRGTRKVALVSGEFEQVILNLCLNARDSMPDGGTLTLRCFEDSDQNAVIVEVEDTGTGMAKEVKDRAIEAFFTTKPDEKGTGLGLAQVSSAVQAVGGRIDIESSVRQGTKVQLILPFAGTVKADRDLAAGLKFNLGHRVKILLLDDDSVITSIIGKALTTAGFLVTTAVSVSEALKHLETDVYDILISDCGLRQPHVRPGWPE